MIRAKVGLLTEAAEILYDSEVLDAEKLRDMIETVGYEAHITKDIREDGAKSDEVSLAVQLGPGGDRGSGSCFCFMYQCFCLDGNGCVRFFWLG